MITQAYVSKSIEDFPFRKTYGLTDYIDSLSPCYFFGMYRPDDFSALMAHRSKAVVIWTGQDALMFNGWEKMKRVNADHYTIFPAVSRMLSLHGIKCNLSKPATRWPDTQAVITGPSVYVYCPKTAKDYHGWQIVKMLKIDSMVVGNGTIPMDKWPDKADSVYSRCYIGLVLNNHAGGGASIIEMGLRGIPVVTNVLSMPHTIPWNTVSDIQHAIDFHKRIGICNVNLSRAVKNYLLTKPHYIQ